MFYPPFPLIAAEMSQSGLINYLGETNVINVLIVIALALFLYKSKNMSITKGLDGQIVNAMASLDDAESIQSAMNYQLSEARAELADVENQRQARIKAARERGDLYAKRSREETQRKLRQLTDALHESLESDSQRIERQSLIGIASDLKQSSDLSLREVISSDKHEALILNALQDIEDIYWEHCGQVDSREVAVR
jgi:F0F1-type ATP synthase membrane subunit b/b'